jgi:multisubunit Na+/H+ antiporter MnhC subunit
MSVAFLFYGLLFYSSGIEAYQSPAMQIFAAIFVSGGFLFTFGQFVPSWDSAYYPLMMSQNIPYRDYIASKWWLVVIGTLISLVLASFYLYFGVSIYLNIIVGAIYNMGVNSHLILLGGAFTKTPIDLASSKQAFGDKKAFNIQTFLLTIPKMLLPVLLYCIGFYLISPNAGLAMVAGAGILGFALRNPMFTLIEKVYKTEKYKALSSYSQKK